MATSVTFVTGNEDPTKPETQTDWGALARTGGTIVLYMGVRRLPTIIAALRAGGLAPDTPAAAIQWGTLPGQRTVVGTIATLVDVVATAGLEAPVITVIGRAVDVRREIAWFDHRPLFGRRVLVTRPTSQAGSLSARLRAAGADVLEMPVTRIEPLNGGLDTVVARFGDYQHLVLTSQNAVTYLWDALRRAGRDARALAGLTVSAVGAATADALLAHGIAVNVVPERFVAEGVVEALAARGGMRGARVLYPTAEGARDVIPEGLRAMGATVEVIHAYRSVPDGHASDAMRHAIEAGEVDLVTFTSASTVRGYVEAVGPSLVNRVRAASIGPVTTDAARAAGIEVAIEARDATIGALVDAIAGAPG